MMTASHPQALPASSFLLVMAKDILLLLRSFTMATVCVMMLSPVRLLRPTLRISKPGPLSHTAIRIIFCLRSTLMSVGETADALGFSDMLYFSKKFRAYTGVSPTDYRKQIQTKYSKMP